MQQTLHAADNNGASGRGKLDPGMSITHTMGFTIQTIFKLDCFY
jgi:hypothetical protein